MKRVVDDVACTVCGCVCDDLRMTIEGDHITRTDGACRLSEQWFLDQNKAQPPAAEIDGRPTTVESAVRKAAELLGNARAPLIYGLSRSSTDGQRAAVQLADRLGATIDTTASRCHAPSIMAIQQVGESTCTLGEARNRCDLVVFWGCDPVHSHPRHAERYSVDPKGMFLPNGRRDRFVIVVDQQRTESADMADRYVQVNKGHDFELIWSLRWLLRGGEAPSTSHGLPGDELRLLAEQLRACRSGIVYFGLGLAQTKMGHATVEALLRLVADLNAHTRFYARRMRIMGGVTGADTVLCWQTGFPFAVNLARGYPRYSPREYSANETLERGEADACLLVGSEGVEQFSTSAVAHLEKIPMIALDYPSQSSMIQPSVHFTTAVYGVHTAGTAYRMDEVPIPLREFLPSDYPADHDVLRAITEAVGRRCV